MHPRFATWYAPNLLNLLSKMAALGELFTGGYGLPRRDPGEWAAGAVLLFIC